MRICMVTRHSCIRVFKEGFALSRIDGVNVDLITNLATFGYNVFDTMHVYSDADMMRRSVQQAAKSADVFHVHNEPDWLVGTVREATGKPIIYDIHDLESLRWQQEPDKDELDSFGLSNGWLHVSDPCRIEAEKYHGNSKPYLTLPSYVNGPFFGPEPAGDVSWSSICYEGGLSSEDKIDDNNRERARNFRNYVPVVQEFISQGYNFFLFGTGKTNSFTYEQMGAVVTAGLPYSTMLAALRPFAFGLVGASVSYPIMEAAMPNKLFEYISQGVVPVCYNADAAADFCEEYGIGIRLDGLDNLKEQLADGPKCRERLLQLRNQWMMEHYVESIINLYEAVL